MIKIYLSFNEDYEMIASTAPNEECPLSSSQEMSITESEAEALKAGHALAIYDPLKDGWQRSLIIIENEAERLGAIRGSAYITNHMNEPPTLDSVTFIA